VFHLLNRCKDRRDIFGEPQTKTAFLK